MKKQLQTEMKEAMKAKEKIRLNTIRSLISAIQYEEMQKGVEELKEDQYLAILKNEAKKRKEAIEYLEPNGESEDLTAARQELTIIESYLPEQFSEDRLKEVLEAYKTEQEGANMGQAMGYLKQNFAGKYDGKAASILAKEIFA